MSERVPATPIVLGWRDGSAVAPRPLWERVEQMGWLPGDPARIVIQVGQRCRAPLAVETARSLATFLQERMPATTIHVVDPAASDGAWGGLQVYDVMAEPAICVAGVAARRGLRVPAFWFEPSYLITVAAAHPDGATRLAAVLDAQADPLRRLRNLYACDVLMYEAHRLAASELSVACGGSSWGDPTAEHWWAVSASDVAVDHAVASAAGTDPWKLPALQTLVRHERVAPLVELRGSLPRLRGYVAPAWVSRAYAARSRVTDSQRAVVHDLVMVRRNLHKIPGFVRRRLAARRRSAA